jgi:hypothetical protein
MTGWKVPEFWEEKVLFFHREFIVYSSEIYLQNEQLKLSLKNTQFIL